jgi:hypothetical protein
LKFLFSLWFGEAIYGAGKNPFSIREEQVPQLFVIYGMGFVIIYSIFFLMFFHALRKKGHLQLSPLEVFDTRTKLYSQLSMVAIGGCAVILALVMPASIADKSGMAYFIIGPVQWLLHWRRAVIRKRD